VGPGCQREESAREGGGEALTAGPGCQREGAARRLGRLGRGERRGVRARAGWAGIRPSRGRGRSFSFSFSFSFF
jgi:hypothetical protein